MKYTRDFMKLRLERALINYATSVSSELSMEAIRVV